MKFLITFVLIASFFTSCKKFVHQDVTPETPACELCAWADSLEGEYEGDYNYIVSSSSMGVFDTVYSAHFAVEHVFMDLGPLDDSTRMFFKVTRTGGNFTSDSVAIWVADDSLSVFRNTGFDEIRMNKDSICLNDQYSQSDFGGGSASITREGVFHRL